MNRLVTYDDGDGDGGDGGSCVDEGGKEHGDGYNMQMGAIIHLLTRFERRHWADKLTHPTNMCNLCKNFKILDLA